MSDSSKPPPLSCLHVHQTEVDSAPVKEESRENALKSKEWEIGMLQDEVAATQGIRIRRRPPSGPPLHYVGQFEFRLQNEDNAPRNILEEIVWNKDKEVTQMKEKQPLGTLKKFLDNAPPSRAFVGALKIVYERRPPQAEVVIREGFDP